MAAGENYATAAPTVGQYHKAVKISHFTRHYSHSLLVVDVISFKNPKRIVF